MWGGCFFHKMGRGLLLDIVYKYVGRTLGGCRIVAIVVFYCYCWILDISMLVEH